MIENQTAGVQVAPLAGAWIEIGVCILISIACGSLPSRERGLKFSESEIPRGRVIVAPLAGAWIEISQPSIISGDCAVAPLAGAWIEIQRYLYSLSGSSVAPLAGAWIEIIDRVEYVNPNACRSPRGSVD